MGSVPNSPKITRCDLSELDKALFTIAKGSRVAFEYRFRGGAWINVPKQSYSEKEAEELTLKLIPHIDRGNSLNLDGRKGFRAYPHKADKIAHLRANSGADLWEFLTEWRTKRDALGRLHITFNRKVESRVREWRKGIKKLQRKFDPYGHRADVVWGKRDRVANKMNRERLKAYKAVKEAIAV